MRLVSHTVESLICYKVKVRILMLKLKSIIKQINSLPKNTPTIFLILHQFNLHVLFVCEKRIGDD